MDDTGRNADRSIKTPDLQEEDASGRSDGRQTEEDSLAKGEDGTGEPRADDAQDDWREVYHREMERRFGPNWQSDSPGTLLKKLGWARVEDWAPRDREDIGDAERDPVARELLDEVSIYMTNLPSGMYVWIAFDGELASLRDEYGSQEGSDSMGSSTSPRQMRDHMARLLPSLQTERRRFRDLELLDYYGWENERSLIEGTLYVERWEREGAEEGLWFCVALRKDQSISEEEVEDHLWGRISHIEELTEGHFESRFDTGVPFVFDD